MQGFLQLSTARQKLVVDVCRIAHCAPISVISESDRHLVFIVRDEGDTAKQFCIKVSDSSNPEDMELLSLEFSIYEFLRRTLGPEHVVLPKSAYTLSEGATWRAHASPLLQGVRWFAQKPLAPAHCQMVEQDLLDLFCRVMVPLHRLQLLEIPSEVRYRSFATYTDQYYVAKFHEYLKPVLAGGYISGDDANHLCRLARLDPRPTEKIVRHFSHHDLVPWNLGRDPEGKLVLVDAEFARWGIAYYDAAYFYLQTRIMLGEGSLARRALDIFRNGYHTMDEDFDHLVLVPLAYRLAANLFVAEQELVKGGDVQQMARAQEALEDLLTRTLW